MAKGPGVSATSRIIATSQTNMQHYSGPYKRLQSFSFPETALTTAAAIAIKIRKRFGLHRQALLPAPSRFRPAG